MEYRNIGEWFHILKRCSQSYIANACEGIGITVYEYNLMINLYRNEGINQEEMAEILMVNKASVARMIKSLEAKGMVRRAQGSNDKRIKNLYTTEKGKAQEAFLLSVLQRWIDFLSEDMDEQMTRTVLDGFKYLSARALQADFSKI